MAVSSLCRGGFLTVDGPDAHRAALAENFAALEEAALLGTDTLVMVVGGLPEGSRDLVGARARVADVIAELAPHADDVGVRMAIEPLHPMFCADRAVVSTLAQALDIAEQHPVHQVGVVVDSYHVWWDPELPRQIERAGPRIASYQVCDWTLPLPADALLGRGHVGDGHIDFRTLTQQVAEAGYAGWIEVEIFNEQIWDTPRRSDPPDGRRTAPGPRGRSMKSVVIAPESSKRTVTAAQTDRASSPHRIPRAAKALAGDVSGKGRD